ncbi:hypothetical protein IWQ61_008988 [Dispira simplex]|nr:hypothetical protein IWQ61_008988 [Dispira simplex]
MKLASVTTLSVVATCLSGGEWATRDLRETGYDEQLYLGSEHGNSLEGYDESVATYLLGSLWATPNLRNPEIDGYFCFAIERGNSPEEYDERFPSDELVKLRQLTQPEVDIEKLKGLPAEEIATAAKVYLLDKAYLETTAHISKDVVLNGFQENSLEAPSYLYFMIAQGEERDIIRLRETNDVKLYSTKFKMLSLDFIQLSTDNPIEDKAVYFIDKCFNY